MLITWSEVSRGVPRSPNRHLDQLRIFNVIATVYSRRPRSLRNWVVSIGGRAGVGAAGCDRRFTAGIGAAARLTCICHWFVLPSSKGLGVLVQSERRLTATYV